MAHDFLTFLYQFYFQNIWAFFGHCCFRNQNRQNVVKLCTFFSNQYVLLNRTPRIFFKNLVVFIYWMKLHKNVS
jgi:hypothetical protein